MPELLTARRQADRQAMALQVADLARAYGLTVTIKPEQPGTRRTDVDLECPHGLGLTVKFDASPGGTDPDTFVLSWHLSLAEADKGTRLHWGMFGNVNSFHGHKATDVARGFAQLKRTLADRFVVISSGAAFVLADHLDGVSAE